MELRNNAGVKKRKREPSMGPQMKLPPTALDTKPKATASRMIPIRLVQVNRAFPKVGANMRMPHSSMIRMHPPEVKQVRQRIKRLRESIVFLKLRRFSKKKIRRRKNENTPLLPLKVLTHAGLKPWHFRKDGKSDWIGVTF